MGTATKVRDLTGWRGDAALFRLDPPLEDGSAFVVASAVDLDFGGFNPGADYRRSETMVFRCDKDGKSVDFSDIGSAPHKSHTDALKSMGYDIA